MEQQSNGKTGEEEIGIKKKTRAEYRWILLGRINNIALRYFKNSTPCTILQMPNYESKIL